jgi:hypothetical protein
MGTLYILDHMPADGMAARSGNWPRRLLSGLMSVICLNRSLNATRIGDSLQKGASRHGLGGIPSVCWKRKNYEIYWFIVGTYVVWLYGFERGAYNHACG